MRKKSDPLPPQTGCRPVRCPVDGMGWLWVPVRDVMPFHQAKGEPAAVVCKLVSRLASDRYIGNQVRARIELARDVVDRARQDLNGAQIQLDRAEAELTELQSMLP